MPEWKDEIKNRLAGLKLEPSREAAIIDELAQHLDDHYAESLSGGATEAGACRAALAELSDSATLQRELRRVEREISPEPIALGTDRRRNMIADFWQDLRYAVRTPRNHPGFAAVVVLTMALGVGINTAIFTLIDIVLHPSPVKDPDAVVQVFWRRNVFSFSDYIYLRDHTQVLSGLTASASHGVTLTNQAAPEESQGITAEYVSDNFFSVLGAVPALGRAFMPEENHTPGKELVVILSYGLWQRRFGGDPKILGQTPERSDDDPAISAKDRELLRNTYPQARAHTFRGAGHASLILKREEAFSIIRCFLDEPGARRRPAAGASNVGSQ